MKQEIIIGLNEKDQRLDKFLRKLFKNVELGLIFKDIRKGNIKVNGKKQSIDYKLKEKDVLRIFGYHYVMEEKNEETFVYDDVSYVKPKVCYEDSNILIAIKDINTLVHSNGDEEACDLTKNVKTYLVKKGDYNFKENLTFSPSPVNRLDRNTYGLVMFGKNNKALIELNTIVRERKVHKYYRTLVEGKIKDGIYKAYIKKDPRTNKSVVYGRKYENSKEIKMNVKNVDTNGVISLIEIELITGRSHQIRSHLKYLGNPIVGDLKYGNKELRNYFFNKYGIENQMLFAYKLIFDEINENMEMNYLSKKVVVMPFPSIFKRIVKQEFKITFRGK